MPRCVGLVLILVTTPSALAAEPDGWRSARAAEYLDERAKELFAYASAHRGGLAWLRANQAAGGEWRCVSLNKNRDPAAHPGKFMTTAATAFAVLALND
jgi:hypothetical protein